MVKKRYIIIALVIVYILIGLMFTIMRSNAHYDFIVIKDDVIEKNGNSYWENRCVDENRQNPFPYAQWCVGSNNEFKTEKPSKFQWYFHMYSNRMSDWFFVLLMWPLHIFGIDLINFRSAGNVL